MLVVWSSVQGRSACQMMLPLKSEYFPNLNSPFMQIMNEQSSFGGIQNHIPSPASTPFPGGFNGLMDFNTLRPFGSPPFGCPPFYGCTRGPYGAMMYGNRSPMLLGFNLAQDNASFLQGVSGEPTEFGDPYKVIIYEQCSGDGKNKQNNKSKQYSPKCRTTRKPCRATRRKIRIVEN